MSQLISGRGKLAQEICAALGLKNVKRLDLHFSVDALVTAEAVFYPEDEDGQRLPAILRHYVLKEREP